MFQYVVLNPHLEQTFKMFWVPIRSHPYYVNVLEIKGITGGLHSRRWVYDVADVTPVDKGGGSKRGKNFQSTPFHLNGYSSNLRQFRLLRPSHTVEKHP